MIFCHGCGKSIHETALNCPNCGAAQKTGANSSDKEKYHWTSISSFVLGIIAMALISMEPDGTWDSDTVFGGVFIGALPIVFGFISLIREFSGRWMALTGLILGIFSVLISLGSI